jgi:hypothetical protein
VHEIVPHGPCIAPRAPADPLLAVQASCHARIIPAHPLPTQAFRQGLRACFMVHRLPLQVSQPSRTVDRRSRPWLPSNIA